MPSKDLNLRYESDADPTVQLRRPVFLPTESLDTPGAEPDPADIVRDLLEYDWVETERAPRPLFDIPGAGTKQVDLRQRDLVSVSADTTERVFTGFRREHVDLQVNVQLTFYTVRSRQRLWNLLAEARRIIYRWNLALAPYHNIFFDRFTPDYEANFGTWEGTAEVRLGAGAVEAFVRQVGGTERANVKAPV